MLGPLTVRVSAVKIGSEEQPVIVNYEGDNGRPFKPCKSMRRVMLFAWGEDGTKWPGKSMTLYNDPKVKFGGEFTGGIRISHISGITGPLELKLTATKGKRALHTILPLADTADAWADPHRAAIRLARNADELKAALKAARAAAAERKDRPAYSEFDKLTATRNTELAAESPSDAAAAEYAKQVANYTAQAMGATSRETAQLAFDEAVEVLSVPDAEKLHAAIAAKFPE
jgi:hypothetical protein